jgi:hypothetical protein
VTKFKKTILFFLVLLLVAFAVKTLFSYKKQVVTLEGRVAKLEQIAGPRRLLCDEKEVVERVKKSLVRIIGLYTEGSGFIAEPNGHVITNYHVIASDFQPKVILPDYSFVQGKVILADKEADFAFLKIERKDLERLSFGDSAQIEPMEELISLGYPLGTGLKGEATAIKGNFVALRTDSDGFHYLQTDITLNSGASGGPMINACGEVVGINMAGLAGLGMGVSANDFYSKWVNLAGTQEGKSVLEGIEKIEFNPNDSPKGCVEAFYNYQTVGELKKAYGLLSREYTTWTFDQWQEGYQNTLNVILYEVKEIDEDTVFVKFSSADLIGEEVVDRFFEGTQRVKKVGGKYKLAESNIKEVENPDWEWFLLED